MRVTGLRTVESVLPFQGQQYFVFLYAEKTLSKILNPYHHGLLYFCVRNTSSIPANKDELMGMQLAKCWHVSTVGGLLWTMPLVISIQLCTTVLLSVVIMEYICF